ncbi:MAG: response regulator [Methanococcaceae archaeon]
MQSTDFHAVQIKRTKILIVDDKPENLEVLGSTLREKGFQIAFATSGRQALSIAAAKLPNLILLDVSMPEMDGFTVCRKLKENGETKNIPVLFLTARIETENIMKALKAGAVDYVSKPFNAGELIGRIMMHLGFDKSPEKAAGGGVLPLLINQLEGHFMSCWKEVRAGMFIDDVLDFAEKLKQFSEENELKLVTDYSNELYQAATLLKIDRMTLLLEQFPAYVKKASQG